MGPTHSYSPTALWRFLRRDDGFHGALKITEGGRFTDARLKTLRKEIDDAMKEDGLVDLLQIGKTLVLGDNPPFNGRAEGYYGPRKLGYGVEPSSEKVIKELRDRKGL